MGWNYGIPKKSGHYLVVWDTVTSRQFPNICSQYDVLHWSGEWYAPVDEKQPIIAWMELPEKPKEA